MILLRVLRVLTLPLSVESFYIVLLLIIIHLKIKQKWKKKIQLCIYTSDELILKSILKGKVAEIDKTILRKKKVGWLTWFYFKTFCEVTVTPAIGHWQNNTPIDDQWGIIEKYKYN